MGEGTQVLTKRQRATTMLEFVAARKPQIEAALSTAARKFLTPDRLIDMLRVAMAGDAKLLECTPLSVVSALMRAAECGLDPSGKGGQGWLIPFKDIATFIPGYKGLRLNLIRSGVVRHVWAYVVYAEDEFEYSLGLDPQLRHVPKSEGYIDPREAWDAISGAYAVALMADGQKRFRYVPKSMLARIRKNAPGGDATIAKKWPEPWCRKTSVRQLAGEIDIDPESLAALTIDAADDGGELGPPIVVDIGEATVVDAPARSDQLADQLETGAEEPEPEPQVFSAPADEPIPDFCPNCEGPLTQDEMDMWGHCRKCEPEARVKAEPPLCPSCHKKRLDTVAQREAGMCAMCQKLPREDEEQAPGPEARQPPARKTPPQMPDESGHVTCSVCGDQFLETQDEYKWGHCVECEADELRRKKALAIGGASPKGTVLEPQAEEGGPEEDTASGHLGEEPRKPPTMSECREFAANLGLARKVQQAFSQLQIGSHERLMHVLAYQLADLESLHSIGAVTVQRLEDLVAENVAPDKGLAETLDAFSAEHSLQFEEAFRELELTDVENVYALTALQQLRLNQLLGRMLARSQEPSDDEE